MTFIKDKGYSDQFVGKDPNSKEFKETWTKLATNDATAEKFANDQYSYVKAQNYDPAVKKLQSQGIDVSGRSQNMQDYVWATSTQFGPNSSLMKNALAGKDVSKMTDEEIISAIANEKRKTDEAGNLVYFKNSDPSTYKGLINRFNDEERKYTGKVTNTPNSGSHGGYSENSNFNPDEKSVLQKKCDMKSQLLKGIKDTLSLLLPVANFVATLFMMFAFKKLLYDNNKQGEDLAKNVIGGLVLIFISILFFQFQGFINWYDDNLLKPHEALCMSDTGNIDHSYMIVVLKFLFNILFIFLPFFGVILIILGVIELLMKKRNKSPIIKSGYKILFGSLLINYQTLINWVVGF